MRQQWFTVGAVAALALGLAAPAQAQMTKMTIATGVDPSFSAYYVAKEAGLFEKNGLDVQINTGPSGSAMIAFLVNNQVNSAYGAEQAGISSHVVDENVIIVAEGVHLQRWLSVVAKDIADIDGLKGKRVGVARGTGSETFWLAVVEKLNLKADDYRIVNVEAPEMVAAMERGNVDAFAVWEPWPTRAAMAIKGAKIIRDSSGIFQNRNFIYMNRGWVEKNRDPSVRFVRSLVEANDLINGDRPRATAMVAKFLRQPPELVAELMPKLGFTMQLTDESMENVRVSMAQLKAGGKLAKDVDWNKFVYPDLLKEVRPSVVKISSLPPKG